MYCTSCGRNYRSRTPDGTKGTGSSQRFQKSVCHLCTGGGTAKDKPVYIRESVSNTFGYAAWDDGKTGKMGFVMEMPLSVKGDDIKTISYHMENGFFQVTDTGETDDMILIPKPMKGIQQKRDHRAWGNGSNAGYLPETCR